MLTRQTPWPTRWLMTDERIGDDLWRAIGRLPSGGGVVFRHYATKPGERAALARRVAALCAERGLVLAVAGDVALAQAVGAALVHNPVGDPGGLAVSLTVHSLSEAEAVRSADLLFVSPLYPTSSHLGTPALGLEKALEIARAGGTTAIALGGMDEKKGREAMAAGFHGWAAIDAWLG
jgi:thiamine-phosphate pyrophosphorylase